jgi:hypothetical protein
MGLLVLSYLARPLLVYSLFWLLLATIVDLVLVLVHSSGTCYGSGVVLSL